MLVDLRDGIAAEAAPTQIIDRLVRAGERALKDRAREFRASRLWCGEGVGGPHGARWTVRRAWRAPFDEGVGSLTPAARGRAPTTVQRCGVQSALSRTSARSKSG